MKIADSVCLERVAKLGSELRKNDLFFISACAEFLRVAIRCVNERLNLGTRNGRYLRNGRQYVFIVFAVEQQRGNLSSLSGHDSVEE